MQPFCSVASVSASQTVRIVASSASGRTTPLSWCHSTLLTNPFAFAPLAKTFGGSLVRMCWTGFENTSGPTMLSTTSSSRGLVNSRATCSSRTTDEAVASTVDQRSNALCSRADSNAALA